MHIEYVKNDEIVNEINPINRHIVLMASMPKGLKIYENKVKYSQIGGYEPQPKI